MMNWADKRLNVNQIKSHSFFYGADWNSLRHIEPPFVPHLQSITDTSYFPTDGLDNLPDHLEKVEGVGAEKHLAFLGCVSLFHNCLSSLFKFIFLTIFIAQIHVQAFYRRHASVRIETHCCL